MTEVTKNAEERRETMALKQRFATIHVQEILRCKGLSRMNQRYVVY
jgi:hypothetical protein